MAERLRLGIVGAGAMAGYHARRFVKLPGVVLSAVCDHEPERASAFASAFGIPRVFTDPASMAASGAVDAFSVASVDGHHAEAVLASLSRSLPVFCEKPLARSLDDAVLMVKAAEGAGVAAIVNYSKRNMTAVDSAAAFVASGALGSLPRASFSYLQSWLLQDSWGDYRTTPRWKWRLSEDDSTFGVIGDLGSHLFDAANLLIPPVDETSLRVVLADRFSPVPGEEKLFPGRRAFISFLASGRTVGGTELEFRGAFNAPGSIDSLVIEISGSRGSLKIDSALSRDDFFLRAGSGDEWTAQGCNSQPAFSTYGLFVSLASGLRPEPGESLPDFRAALAVQKIIAACAARV